MAGFIDLSSTFSRSRPTFDQPSNDNRAIIWLDIDNTLYAKSTQIHILMQERIRAYFQTLGLDPKEAEKLHKTYYSQYGLAIRGLVKHHDINALDYDRVCDASLPLETILSRDDRLRQLLSDIDPSKARILALTNAYKTHASRVLEILGVIDLIEGLVFCDYGRPDQDFGCKPEPSFFQEAIEYALPNHSSPEAIKHYFVDDSLLNVKAAVQLGWQAVHFKEPNEWDTDHDRISQTDIKLQDGHVETVSVVENLKDLRVVWKELFKA
ncbi:Haloacid dehalogenase-like hydrolase [Phaffia rhodozyma]|uniref:Haloacid dehalogenase-like hydrolase n=1 Tax=Phaffia rhodozyma TaxID=264483 RepID=A0A0F7SUF8_PHARH|nr:Haloacid dehalogenase-like hydrolase [Phaffia rhodozyma]